MRVFLVLGKVNSWLTQKTITKHKGRKHILADQAMHTYGTNQGPNALEYVEVLKSQTDESYSYPRIPGTHTVPK